MPVGCRGCLVWRAVTLETSPWGCIQLVLAAGRAPLLHWYSSHRQKPTSSIKGEALQESSAVVCSTVHCSRVLLLFVLQYRYNAPESCGYLFYRTLQQSSAVVCSTVVCSTVHCSRVVVLFVLPYTAEQFCCCLLYRTLQLSSAVVCSTLHCSRVLLLFVLQYTAWEFCYSLFYRTLQKSSAVVCSTIHCMRALL